MNGLDDLRGEAWNHDRMMFITLMVIRMDIEGANTAIYRRLRISSNFWRSKALLPLHGFQGFCFRRR